MICFRCESYCNCPTTWSFVFPEAIEKWYGIRTCSASFYLINAMKIMIIYFRSNSRSTAVTRNSLNEIYTVQRRTSSNIVHQNLKNTNGIIVQHCLPTPLSYPSNRNSEEVYHYINQQLSTVMMILNDNLVMVGVKFYCFSLDMTHRDWLCWRKIKQNYHLPVRGMKDIPTYKLLVA